MTQALEEYFGAILDGRIVACEKMKLVSERILSAYEHPGEYHFDAEIAARHTDFIERFCHLPAGRRGVPFTLELFQKARLEVIFGFVDDNDLRQIQEVLIIEGRKNGKTTETAPRQARRAGRPVHRGTWVSATAWEDSTRPTRST